VCSENFLVSLNFSAIFESCQIPAYSYYNNHYHPLRSKGDSSVISGAFISGKDFKKSLSDTSSRGRGASVLFGAWRGYDFEDEV
jgi:hypothetical protein